MTSSLCSCYILFIRIFKVHFEFYFLFFQSGNGEIEEAVSQTVGERLKSLLTSPGGNQPTRLPSTGSTPRHVTPRNIPNAPAPVSTKKVIQFVKVHNYLL